MEWQQQDTVLFSVSRTQMGNGNIAAFDLDNTLIVTKSGRIYPENAIDWKIKYPHTKNVLRALAMDGYHIVIFTNQKWLIKNKLDAQFKHKIERIQRHIGVEFSIFIATEDDMYRKPMTGMWKMFCKVCGIRKVNAQSFYCGDAAGRIKDHSCSDLQFARHIELQFYTDDKLGIIRR